MQIDVQTQLEGEYSYCSAVFVPQQFGLLANPKKKHFRKQLIPQHFQIINVIALENLKLNDFSSIKKDIRKFSMNKVYFGDLTCFTCKKAGHFATICPFKVTQEDLLDVMVDLSVYSIILEHLSSLIFEPYLSSDSTFLDTILSNR